MLQSRLELLRRDHVELLVLMTLVATKFLISKCLCHDHTFLLRLDFFFPC